jgi:hypothetical protein
MKFKITLAAISVATIFSNAANASDSFVGIGYSHQSVDIASETMEGRSIVLEGGVKFNPYFSISAWTGFNGDKEVLRSQNDTYVNTSDDVIGEFSEVKTDTYDSTFEMTKQYGVNATFYMPVRDNLDLYVSAGYGWYEWEGEMYDYFDDSKPASNPLDSFLAGASDCEITGNESLCENEIKAIASGGSIKTPVGSAGIIWGISKTTSLTAGYSKSFKDDIDVSSFSLGIRFQF